DDDEDRYLLNYSFTEIGLDENVKFFGDSLQFIKYVELISSLNVKPSLIIMDYKIPYMNGKALVEYLKSKSGFKEVPVVILTHALADDIKEKLLDMGVAACYVKGVNYEQLTDELREIVKYAVIEPR
ncbi:MAG TPA: response regulator, partial [Flavisolibacter sp.]|nr:response regulator [Flavisolibacter sp.]